MVKVYHQTKSNYRSIPDFNTFLTLEGHHHFYKFHDNIISLPPLYDTSDAGFIELTSDNNKYIARYIGFKDNHSYTQRDIKVLKKNK